MDKPKVWTAAELDAMSPAERAAVYDATTVKDLDAVPPRILARLRATVAARAGHTDR